MDMNGTKMLVVAAHPGDVLWRCSGAIAKHVKLGGIVDVVVLTYGTGGEANELFKAGYTVEQAREQRMKILPNPRKFLGYPSLSSGIYRTTASRSLRKKFTGW